MSHPDLKEDSSQSLQLHIAQLDKQIKGLSHPTLFGAERQTAIERCQAELAHLSNEVKNASFRLPAYEQRLHSDAIKALHEEIEQVQAASASKRKFAFKSRIPKGGSQAIAENLSKSPDDLATKSKPNDQGSPSLANRSPLGTININGSKGEQVVLPPLATVDDASQAAASIYDVQDCTVDLRARSSIGSPLAKLQIFNARQTLIICGAVSGSVFVSESQDCVLLATSGQMRFYKCDNCAVYLHCTSKPVIELSDRIKFAPLPSILTAGRYPQSPLFPAKKLRVGQDNLSSQHQKSNSWDQVEDFNWLHNDASPHWKIIANDDRISDELWQTAFNGERERQTLQSILSDIV